MVTQSDGCLVAQTDGRPERREPVALPDDRLRGAQRLRFGGLLGL